MRPKSPPAIWTGKAGWKYEKSITKTPAAGTEERYWKISRYFSVYDGDDCFVSGFLVADESMLYAYDESFEKYNVENGNFTTEQKLTDNQRTRLEKEKVTIYENFYKDEDADTVWIRNQRARFVFLKTERGQSGLPDERRNAAAEG